MAAGEEAWDLISRFLTRLAELKLITEATDRSVKFDVVDDLAKKYARRDIVGIRSMYVLLCSLMNLKLANRDRLWVPWNETRCAVERILKKELRHDAT